MANGLGRSWVLRTDRPHGHLMYSGQGTTTVSGAGTVGQQFLVGTQAFTWVTTRGGAGQVSIGTSANSAATNIRTAINADIPSQVAAAGNGSSVVVTAVVCGSAGNLIPFSNVSSANLAFNGPALSVVQGRATMLGVCGCGKATTAVVLAAASLTAQPQALPGQAAGAVGPATRSHSSCRLTCSTAAYPAATTVRLLVL